jgi:hypothetical protein
MDEYVVCAGSAMYSAVVVRNGLVCFKGGKNKKDKKHVSGLHRNKSLFSSACYLIRRRRRHMDCQITA